MNYSGLRGILFPPFSSSLLPLSPSISSYPDFQLSAVSTLVGVLPRDVWMGWVGVIMSALMPNQVERQVRGAHSTRYLSPCHFEPRHKVVINSVEKSVMTINVAICILLYEIRFVRSRTVSRFLT